jgi:hypothetical protein
MKLPDALSRRSCVVWISAGCLLLLAGTPNLLLAASPLHGQSAATGSAPTRNEQTQPTALKAPVSPTGTAAGAPSDSEAQSTDQSLPDSPGSVRLRAEAAQQQPPAPKMSAPQTQPSSSDGIQQPLGAAAAESTNTSGVAASEPAGAAIAPAKQRRVRSFLIKMGAVVGAGIAIGTVFALSSASPSRPPGSQ